MRAPLGRVTLAVKTWLAESPFLRSCSGEQGHTTKAGIGGGFGGAKQLVDLNWGGSLTGV